MQSETKNANFIAWQVAPVPECATGGPQPVAAMRAGDEMDCMWDFIFF
jgi:hypothetical protein